MRAYLTPPAPSKVSVFDPPCVLFDAAESFSSPKPQPPRPRTIVEIGSGTGFLSLHLAPHLRDTDTLILTDLEEVCALLETNLSAARARWQTRLSDRERRSATDIRVRPLPWGSQAHLDQLIRADLDDDRPDIVLASDLVYFPFLYPGLLRSLIGLTARRDSDKAPTVLLFSYKIRSLVREQPFWSAFGRWFRFEPVLISAPSPAWSEDRSEPNRNDDSGQIQFGTSTPVMKTPASPPTWTRFGTSTPSLSTATDPGHDRGEDTDELFLFICSRRPASYDWLVPSDDDELMSGQDPDMQFELLMLGGLEWD